MVLFVAFWQRGLSASGRLLIVLALFVGIVGLALMQPNAVFTAAVFLAPYCVVLAYRAGGRLPGKTLSVHAKKILAGMLCGFAIVAIWLLLYKTPFLQSTVSFSWPSFASVRQAVVNAVLLAYVKQAQVALAVLVCCGIVYTLRNRKYLWMSVSFAIASLFYVVNASTDSLAKAVLTGFWYADPYRIAAMAAICAVPLAGLGFYAFIKFVIRFCDKLDLPWLAFGEMCIRDRLCRGGHRCRVCAGQPIVQHQRRTAGPTFSDRSSAIEACARRVGRSVRRSR